MKIDLKTFIADEKLLLDQFEEFWTRGHQNNADAFPAKLGAGEWNEMFVFFVEDQIQRSISKDQIVIPNLGRGSFQKSESTMSLSTNLKR